MANCFGEPIDNGYLRGHQLKYARARSIPQRTRAMEAYAQSTRDKIDEQARSYAMSLKAAYGGFGDGDGDGETTLCLVYNATGDTVHYVADRDYSGYIGRTPYPVEIHNGQWAAFHHVHTRLGWTASSEAAVVYRGKNSHGEERDFLIAWSTPSIIFHRNKAYCQIGSVDTFQGRWGSVYDALNHANYHHTVEAEGSQILADTAKGDSPIFKATLTLDVVTKN